MAVFAHLGWGQVIACRELGGLHALEGECLAGGVDVALDVWLLTLELLGGVTWNRCTNAGTSPPISTDDRTNNIVPATGR